MYVIFRRNMVKDDSERERYFLWENYNPWGKCNPRERCNSQEKCNVKLLEKQNSQEKSNLGEKYNFLAVYYEFLQVQNIIINNFLYS